MPAAAPAAFTVLIPARLASTRLPDKPLADIAGLPMVVRVAQRAFASRAGRVVVAADHASIVAACEAHGIQALLTRTDHPSGSDRLAEACALLQLDDDAIVVNVQGDEPLIDPELIDAVADTLAAHPATPMSTAVHAIDTPEDFANPNVVKAVLDGSGHAMYFSRAPIPWWRDGFSKAGLTALPSPPPLRHIGIYGYRAGFVRRFPELPPRLSKASRHSSSCACCGTDTASQCMCRTVRQAPASTRRKTSQGCERSSPNASRAGRFRGISSRGRMLSSMQLRPGLFIELAARQKSKNLPRTP